MPNINFTIIVTAANAPLARSIAAKQGTSGEGMFERPVYTLGILTDYISSGQINDIFATMLTDADVLFAAANGEATLVQCQDLIATSHVCDCNIQSPFALLDSLGKTL